MYLTQIKLRDWKTYAQETVFSFPRPTRNRNIVVVGAQNGYGKTSLLEAIVVGLYGRDGLKLVARADGTGDESKLQMNYSQFLQRALHKRALAEGRSSMTVELTLGGVDDVNELTIGRTWHFSGSGKHNPGDDELMLWEGVERRPKSTPRMEDRDDYLRGQIARAALPSHLAGFFLFDGEQVQRLAQRDMASQVRRGIEGLLGAEILRELGGDLDGFLTDRASKAAPADGAALIALQNEVDQLQQEHLQLGVKIEEAARHSSDLAIRQDELMATVTGGRDGEIANLKELQERKASEQQVLNRARESLQALLMGDFALGLSGRQIRQKTLRQLNGELAKQRWEASIGTTRDKLESFIATVMTAPPPADPELSDAQITSVTERIRFAWQRLWHPPPSDCAEVLRHGYMSDSDRQRVVHRLADLDKLGVSTIEDLLSEIDQHERQITKLERQMAELGGMSDQLPKLQAELREVQEKIAKLAAESEDARRRKVSLEGQLQAKRAELGRLREQVERSAPGRAQSELATRVRKMLDVLLERSVPLYTELIATYMSEAYRELSHKGLVQSVRIDRECNVELLTQGGEVLKDIDASAGESQVFAFALISAISRSTNIQFPIVIDTPLARMDKQHRLNILRHFGERAGEQIIFLTQDTELVGQYYEAVKPRVAKTFLVEHKKIGEGIGKSTVYPDKYFESER